MKKLTVLLLILLISFIIIGCKKTDKSEKKAEDNNGGKASTINLKELDINEDIKILALFENNLFYKKEVQALIDTSDEEYFVKNIITGESNLLGDIKNLNIDSGDFQIMNNKYIYMSPGVYKNDNLFSEFIKFDISKSKNEIISEGTNINPLIYFNKLNNEEFTIHGAIYNEKSNEYNYYIDTYNYETNKRKNIIKSIYSMDNQSGRAIVSVSVNNGKIYVYILEQNTNSNKHLIEIFDSTGNSLEVIELKKLDHYLKDTNGDIDSVFNLTVFKDYIHIYTLNGKSILFRYDNKKLELIDLDENNRMQLVDLYNENLDNIKNNKVYLVDKNINTLYYLDLNTSKVETLNVNIEEGYTINDCVVNENGNLIVKCLKNENNYKYYFIEN